MVAEGVGAVVAEVASIGVLFGFLGAGGYINCSEDLEDFEEGGEGNLKICCFGGLGV